MNEKPREIGESEAYQMVLENMANCDPETLRSVCPEGVLPFEGEGSAFLIANEIQPDIPQNFVFLSTPDKKQICTIDPSFNLESGEPVNDHLTPLLGVIPGSNKTRKLIVASSRVTQRVCKYMSRPDATR